MATSIFSNLLYANNNDSNDTDQRDTNPTVAAAAMSNQERQQILSLLQASAKFIEEGTCDAVIYQTMGALHRYTAVCAGLLPSDKVTNLSNQLVTVEQQQQPAFVMQQSNNNNYDDDNSNSTNVSNSEHEDALAYGWVEELSSGEGSKPSEDVAWNSVLALLVQKEVDDEPCLWITKEVLAKPHDRNSDQQENRDETDNPTRGSATELESLHSIPLRRRLRLCRYQNFYGDHRVVLELKRFGRTNIAGFQLARPKTGEKPNDNDSSAQQIVLRCPSAASAKAWVECLTEAKKKSQTHATDVAIELEMVDEGPEFSPSTSIEPTVRTRNTARLVNVIDSEDNSDEYAILEQPGDVEPAVSPTKRLAEQLQEAEDRKRALKQAVQQAAAFERIRQQQEEEHARERKIQQKLDAERREREKREAIEKARLDAIERKKEEEFQRKRLAVIEKNVESIVEIEKRKIQENKLQREKQKLAAVAAAKANTSNDTATIATAKASNVKPKPKPMTAAEKQQLRMEREIAARKRAEEERRRIEIEYEQKKKERVEQRRRDLEAKRKAAREEQRRKEQIQKQKFLESEQRKEAMKAAAMKAVPKKAVSGVFTKRVNDTKNDKKGDLWSSLDKHMSAFEADDEERKRKEAEKREEEKAKAEAEEKEKDPEQVRKRVAEEARQKLVQEEAEKLGEEADDLKKMKQTEASKLGGAFHQQQRSTSPHPSTSTFQTTAQHRQTDMHSTTTPAPTQQQHHNVTSNPASSVPPLQHPQTQSWNKMQQPPYPSQQEHFQRAPQPTGENYMQPGPRTQGFRQQQPSNGSFVNPLHPTHPMQPQSQTQRPSVQPQPPPRAAAQSAMPQQPQPATSQPKTNGESSESEIKKSVLIKWGLQPPAMQTLKPVDQLLCSIHSVFPPSFGVPSHEYFQGWQPISRSELVSSSGVLEENKLKKSVRKVRFFLHPDKLPHDLTESQAFLCKLLWDVINDAFEEYKKSKEDLDWM